VTIVREEPILMKESVRNAMKPEPKVSVKKKIINLFINNTNTGSSSIASTGSIKITPAGPPK
jgi:hypothetical protein